MIPCFDLSVLSVCTWCCLCCFNQFIIRELSLLDSIIIWCFFPSICLGSMLNGRWNCAQCSFTYTHKTWLWIWVLSTFANWDFIFCAPFYFQESPPHSFGTEAMRQKSMDMICPRTCGFLYLAGYRQQLSILAQYLASCVVIYTLLPLLSS
jgi:hypothetical protein